MRPSDPGRVIPERLRVERRRAEVFRKGVCTHVDTSVSPYLATIEGRTMPYIDPTINAGDVVFWVDQPDPFAWAKTDPLEYQLVTPQITGGSEIGGAKTVTGNIQRPGNSGSPDAGKPCIVLHFASLSNGTATLDSTYTDNVEYVNENGISLAWSQETILNANEFYTIPFSTTVTTYNVGGWGFYSADDVQDVQTSALLTGTGPWAFPEVTALVDNTMVLYVANKINDGVSGSFLTVPGTPIFFPTFAGVGGPMTWYEILDAGETSDGELELSASTSVRLTTFSTGLIA